MKENVTLLLLSIPLTVVLWLGMRFYLNPGKPALWVPEIKIEEEKKPESPPPEQEEGPAGSSNASKNRLIQEINRSAEQTTSKIDSEALDESQSKTQAKAQTDSQTETQNDSQNESQNASRTDSELEYPTEQNATQGVEHGITVTFGSTKLACLNNAGYFLSVNILFREQTAAIKAGSLTSLNNTIALYHDCDQGFVKIEYVNTMGETATALQRRRLDEVKYHLLHMRVSRVELLLPEKL